MSGPTPKPRDKRTRRNKNEGTTSTTVVLPPAVDLPEWAGKPVTLKMDGFEVTVPKPPNNGKLLKVAIEAWANFWLHPEAQMLRPHHMPALRRLVLLYDEEERLRRAIEEERLVPETIYLAMDGRAVESELVVDVETRMRKLPGRLAIGSTGQLVSSPEVAQLDKVRTRIQALEDRFAATPLAQFKVGWQQAEMYNSQAKAAEAAAIVQAARELSESHAQLLAGGDA